MNAHGSYGRCPGPQAQGGPTSGYRSTQHAIDAAARAADVATVARSDASDAAAQAQRTPHRCARALCRKSTQDGPDAHDDARTIDADARRRGQGRRHLGAGAPLVHENDALGRSTSTLRKTMRKTQTQRAATTSPTSKLRTTRWKSRTMQQLATGKRPELDFGPTKDELAQTSTTTAS